MPKQINTPSFGQELVRRFGLKGRYQPVLDETIVPVTDVGREEEAWPAFGGGTAAPAAAEYQCSTLENPASSKVRLWVQQLSASTAASQVMLTKDALWTLGTKVQFTSEWTGIFRAGSPAGEIYIGNSTALPASRSEFPTGGSRPCALQFPPRFLAVNPGEVVQMLVHAVNTQAYLRWEWLEVPLNITSL